MKIWLTGSLLGDSGHGIPMFEDVANRLRGKGHEPFVPGEVQPWQHDGEDCPGPVTALGHAQACFLRTRIPAMLQCDAILMPEGWYDDRVVRIERRAAMAAGLAVYKSTYEVRPVLRVDPGTAEIIAEIKAMDYPHGTDFPNELAEEDDEDQTPDELRVSNAYERGLSDGEDQFWRTLGKAIMTNGHSDRCAAVRLGELAVTPPADRRSPGYLDTLARRMYGHGVESLRRKGLDIHVAPDARQMLRTMILFVTGKDAEE